MTLIYHLNLLVIFGVDILDVKNSVISNDSLLQVGYTSAVSLNIGFNQSQINASKNIYLLSERGYAKRFKGLVRNSNQPLYEEIKFA